MVNIGMVSIRPVERGIKEDLFKEREYATTSLGSFRSKQHVGTRGTPQRTHGVSPAVIQEGRKKVVRYVLH